MEVGKKDKRFVVEMCGKGLGFFKRKAVKL